MIDSQLGAGGKKNGLHLSLMAQSQKWVWWSVIGAGTTLWLVNWWAGRPLFLDEANVARNLFDRSFAGLFSPLDHRQYAPPLYLLLAKASGELFGYGERALRAPALFGGFLALSGLYRAGRALQLGWWGLLPLALLFVSPEVLRYVGEIKPYALDLGVAAMLLAFALEKPGKSWLFWVLTGTIAVWVSLPSIFVLASIALTNFFCTGVRAPQSPNAYRLRWAATGFSWLLSFLALYLLVLRPAIGSDYLNNYHEDYFFPLPQADYPWRKLAWLLFSVLRLTFGFTLLATTLGPALAFTGFLKSARKQLLLLSLPIALVLFASGFGFYSMLPRLLLFTLPGSWLLAALGGRSIYERAALSGHWKYVFLTALTIMLGGTNVVRHYWRPLSFSDSRKLTTEIADGYTPVLHYSSLPGFDYYHRIHPVTRQIDSLTVHEGNIRQQEFPGDYVLLYDVLTQGNVRESMRSDSIWATARGCKVRTEAMFRAKAVYVECE